MTIVCSACGNPSDDDSDFCPSCGEPVEWAGVRVAEEEPAPASEAPAEASPAGPVEQKPAEEARRRAPRALEDDAEEVAPGDLVCTRCGTGNTPANRFCRRCGASLAEAPVAQRPPWWKRFLGLFRLGRRRRFAAGERRRKQAEGGGRKSAFWMFQGGIFKLVGLVTVAVIAFAVLQNWRGPLIDRFWGAYHPLHDVFLTSYHEVQPVRATASSNLRGHPPVELMDTAIDRAWISKPTRRDGVLQTVTVYLQQPYRVGKVGIYNGDQATQTSWPREARVHRARVFFFQRVRKHLRLIPGKSRLCSFADTRGRQTCGVDVRNVSAVKLRTLSVYAPVARGGKSLAISEILVYERR